MSAKVSMEHPLGLLTKWSEGHLDLLGERQRLCKETTQSVLDVLRDLMDRRAPEESMMHLCGNMLELCRMPLSPVGGNGNWEEVSREFRRLVAETPFAVSGNGFSEELRAYGKATWENGSRASSDCMNWMRDLLREQKITTDGTEAGQIVKSCLDLTESFLQKSLACWMDQVKAGSGLVKTSLLKEKYSTAPMHS